jgi:enoyl-CoA hydratase/carnithine racemase
MKQFQGQTLSWDLKSGIIELALHREPLNEIGSATLEELEKFVATLDILSREAHALILHSKLKAGFCAGADLRQLYGWIQEFGQSEIASHAREYLKRIHSVMNALDSAPLTTIAAVHGVTFGGGFELALTCDLIIADKLARFCFPELRLGLIPSFGGIPRLKRDLGNAVVRDLLLTGRSFNTTKAQQIGLVSQVVGEGQVLGAARATAKQIGKFDHATAVSAKRFIKPIPLDELREEIDIFCELLPRPAVQAGLKKFVESTDAQPYLP